MLKPNWKSPAIQGMIILIAGGLILTGMVIWGMQGIPYEPYMLLVVSMGLVPVVVGSIAFVQIVRHEHAVDESIRKHNESGGKIKLEGRWL